MVKRTLEDFSETAGQYADIDGRVRPWLCGTATSRGRTVTGTGGRE